MRQGDPIELYAFLDIENPMVAWEVAVGRVASHVGIAPDGFGISTWLFAVLRAAAANGVSRGILNEFNLELVRQQSAPSAVSRLDGLYFFRSLEEALVGLDRWGWHAKRDLLSRVLVWPTQLTEVDSEWITKYLTQEDTDWMASYWEGRSEGSDPIVEVLARGVGLVDNFELRRRAYETMMSRYPLFSKVLSFAAAGFWCGHDTVAQMKPGVVLTHEGLTAAIAIYMKDLEGDSGIDWPSVFEQCRRDGAVFPYDPRFDDSDVLVVPDFSDLAVTIANMELRDLGIRVHGGL